MNEIPTTRYAKCNFPMSTQYRCQGCDIQIHWFCSLGYPELNESKGHGAHYWCEACYTTTGPGAPSLKKKTATSLKKKSSPHHQKDGLTTSMTGASSSFGQKQGLATLKHMDALSYTTQSQGKSTSSPKQKKRSATSKPQSSMISPKKKGTNTVGKRNITIRCLKARE
jgi:hypothetical protein